MLVVGLVLGASLTSLHAGEAAPARVFEIRTYYTHPGRLDALHKRFREHTMRIFANHGMTNIGYWAPQDAPAHDNTLIYVIAHASREQAKENWKAFGSDPEWKKVAAESEKDGKIVEKVESVFMDATDYSPLR
jgi:hypothetical protein